MSVSLFGAITAAELAPITDDPDALRSAAHRLLAALGETAATTARANTAWNQLPAVLQADTLTPALAPLMTPANQAAAELQDAAEQFNRIASAAATQLDALKTTYRSLTTQIDAFHTSAAGKAAHRN